MTTLDMVIKGGEIYSSTHHFKASIAIKDGKIVAIGAEQAFPKALKVIDATGKVVIPGVIDAHSHFRDPGYTNLEDYETGTRAAAAGGVTTTIDMPNTNPVPNTLEKFEAHKKNALSKALVDFSHWASPTHIDEIEKIAGAKALGFKIFMKGPVMDTYPYVAEAYIGNDYVLLKTLQKIAEVGLPCLVHPWNQQMWISVEKEKEDSGRTNEVGYREAYCYGDFIIFTSAIAKLMEMVRVTGVKLSVLHNNWNAILQLIRHYRRSGYKFLAEMNPWGIFHTDSMKKKYGYPFEEEIIWPALNDGTIDYISSDHIPLTKEDLIKKDEMENKFRASGGHVGGAYLEHYLSFLLTEVNHNRLSLERVVHLCSENIAKIFGLYPKKGLMAVGSDADITIIDMEKEEVIRSEKMYSKMGFSTYEGRSVKGVPIYTISRGTVVMEEGKVIGKPGHGQFVGPQR